MTKQQTKPQFTIGYISLSYNSIPKLLGITLDEQLSFETLIQNVAKQASSSLKIIKEVRVIMMCMCLWYSPSWDMEQRYGNGVNMSTNYPVCSGNHFVSSWTPWNIRQRSGGSSCRNIPLDLYFRRTSIRELAKIQATSFSQPVKTLLCNMTETTQLQVIPWLRI